MAFPRKKIKVKDHDWSYIKIGQGEPLLLIHGIVNFADFYLPMAELLKNNFEVIIPDLPGFGFTKRLDGENTFKAISESLIELANNLGYKKINVFGTSLGGLIGLDISLKHPELINKLIIHSAPWRKGDINMNAFEKIIIHHLLYKMPAKIDTFIKDRLVVKLFPLVMKIEGKRAKETYDLYRSKIDESLRLCDVATTLEIFKSVENVDIKDHLHKTKVKTLVLVGDADQYIEILEEKLLAKKISAVRFEIVKNADHGFIINDAPEAANLINNFIQSK